MYTNICLHLTEKKNKSWHALDTTISYVVFGTITHLFTGYSDNIQFYRPQHQLFPSIWVPKELSCLYQVYCSQYMYNNELSYAD